MSGDALQFLGTVATALLALAGIYLATRQGDKKTKVDAAQVVANERQEMLDQLQEERNELKRERTELKERVANLESEVRASRRRELTRDDFIQSLRNHIRLDKGPPPPDWPAELRNG